MEKLSYEPYPRTMDHRTSRSINTDMKPLTRPDLDAVMAHGCGNPHCEHKHTLEPLFLHSRCHVDSPIEASYFDGVLTVSCMECQKVIVTIAVADP